MCSISMNYIQQQIRENQRILQQCMRQKAEFEQEKRRDEDIYNVLNGLEPKDVVQIQVVGQRIRRIHSEMSNLEREIYSCLRNISSWEKHMTLHDHH